FDPEAFKELLKSAEKGTYTIVDGKTIIPASSGDATLTAVPLDPEAVQKLLASAKKGKLTVVEGVDVKNLVAAKGITNGTLSFPEGAVKVTGTPIDPATVKKLLQANGKAVETLTAGATQGTLTISSKKLSPELIAQMKELQLKTSKAESTQSTPAETE
ncbi:hypothetical protein K0U00_36635, partial [Paenibacillus sepulcri]|nr:hypothetical protein [Paenibacillus sepulcri]